MTVVPSATALPQRPAPPKTLSETAQQRWRDIVSELPADYFRASDRDLLEQLIRTEEIIETCNATIEKDGLTTVGGQGQLVEHPAVKIRARALGTVAVLQTKLRLCPSTRMRADAAKLQKRSGKKLWEG